MAMLRACVSLVAPISFCSRIDRHALDRGETAGDRCTKSSVGLRVPKWTGAVESGLSRIGDSRVEHCLRSGPVMHSPQHLGRYEDTMLEMTRLRVRDQARRIISHAA
jgi:hypothetical protein